MATPLQNHSLKSLKNLSNASIKQRFQAERNTPLLHRTRLGRTRGVKAAQVGGKTVSKEIEEIVILRAENVRLKTAVDNLEHTLSVQNNDLVEFRATLKFLELDLKKTMRT